MKRLDVIKSLMKSKKLNNYLEVGVSNGHVFFRIKSSFKVAVDPSFAFDKMRVMGKLFVNPYNVFNRYFETTSDDFFLKNAKRVFENKKPELILIDGMHEYDFALRDIENTLNYMSDNGVIVVHDCNPQTKEAASSYKEYAEGNYSRFWNGDVWKAILHLQCHRKDLNVFVLDADHGLGIITRGVPDQVLNFSQKEIEAFTYEDFEKSRASWINLKHPDYFYDYFKIDK